jgi:UDP-glucose 4-epimerase
MTPQNILVTGGTGYIGSHARGDRYLRPMK